MNFADVENEYKKDPDLKKEEVQKLLVWNSKQPHLPKMTEFEAILFLHASYYKIENAKVAIDKYFTSRTHFTDIFSSRDDLADEVLFSNEVACWLPLETLTPEGYNVVLSKLNTRDVSKFVFVNAIKFHFIVADLIGMQQGITKGRVLVLDMEGVSMGHVLRMNPTSVKHFLYFVQEAQPVRLKAAHFLNCPPFMDKVMAILKPFLQKDLVDLLHFHQDFSSITKVIPAETFPSDYPDGKAESMEVLRGKVSQELKKWREFFLEDEKRKVNEKLRPKNSRIPDAIFGADGNFRKLEID